ncbi:LPXTG cell wall anchor domain-containing protein [Lactobacillus hominis]|uniref:LPXTG cell wall anchor domain-containing protein n=1 Tax=Lactobacillus hominis TaxID=1203033 RepID=UPI00260E4C7E|nr:LPXTG cell wall anchor domain-containing protein [Lactobacillus hominis]
MDEVLEVNEQNTRKRTNNQRSTEIQPQNQTAPLFNKLPEAGNSPSSFVPLLGIAVVTVAIGLLIRKRT